jgi:hypothetical protein
MLKKRMRRFFFLAGLIILTGMSAALPDPGRLPKTPDSSSRSMAQQGYSSSKTTENYMETVLSRNTKPLGLKEDVILRNLLRQRAVKWAVRAGIRDILD